MPPDASHFEFKCQQTRVARFYLRVGECVLALRDRIGFDMAFGNTDLSHTDFLLVQVKVDKAVFEVNIQKSPKLLKIIVKKRNS